MLSKEVKIDVKNWQKGMYFFLIKNNTGIIANGKFIKN